MLEVIEITRQICNGEKDETVNQACKILPYKYIYIAGDYDNAVRSTREYCDQVGYCVTVTPTTYVYTSGSESGVIIGLINYPRFPADYTEILKHATAIAEKLRVDLGQESYSIETPDSTIWYSYRENDIIKAD